MKFTFSIVFFLGLAQNLPAADAPKPNAPKKEKSLLDSAKEGVNDIMNSESMQKAKELGKDGIEKGKEIKDKVVGARTSRDNRRDSCVSLYWDISYGTWVPLKNGFVGTWLINENWSLEAEYFSGSLGVTVSHVDLVEFSERLMQARARWYLANSFNIGLGLGQRDYSFSLGDDFVAKAAGYDAALPSLEVKNQFVSLALSNRWQFDNGFSWGVDWLELIATVGQGEVSDNVTPFFTDQKSKENTKEALKVLRYGPTLNIFKLQIGYTF